MNASGTGKLRIVEARRALLAFYRSKSRKTVIDISGLRHAEVAKILYGKSTDGLLLSTRYLLSLLLYPFPCSRLKVFLYRCFGAHIGSNVYISPGVYIDTVKPSLLSIGDNVMIGMGVKIAVHERTMETLSLGRVSIGNNVTIGGLSIIRCATVIGDNVHIDMMCTVKKNVPSGTAVVVSHNARVNNG